MEGVHTVSCGMSNNERSDDTTGAFSGWRTIILASGPFDGTATLVLDLHSPSRRMGCSGPQHVRKQPDQDRAHGSDFPFSVWQPVPAYPFVASGRS